MNTTAPTAYRLMQIVAEAQQALERLRVEHGQIIEGDDELRAALAEEDIPVDEVLSRLGRAALDAAADVEAANIRLTHLAARRDRAARREETLRATLLQALLAVGARGHKDAEFTASWRYGKPKLHLTEEDLPAELVEIRTTRVPDRAAIRARLEAAEPVPGATLGNAMPVLTLRRS